MKRTRIAGLLASSFFFWSAQYLYVPSLAEYVKLQVVSLAMVGVVLSMYGLWQGIVRIPLGVIVDATGHGKPYLIGGFLLSGLGAAVMGAGHSAGALTLGRALTGVAAGTWVPMIVIFASFFPPERAVFAASLLTFSSSFGQVVATSLTGLINQSGGYRLTFDLAAISALAAVAIIAIVPLRPPASPRLEEAGTARQPRLGKAGPVEPARSKVTVSSILSVFARRDVLAPSFAGAVLQFGNWAVVFSFLPLLAKQLGASDLTTGLLVSVAVIAGAAANLLATFLANRMEMRGVLVVNFLLFAGGIVLAALARGIGTLFVSTVLIGIATGFGYPILMGLSIQRVDGARRTTAMGIHQAVYSIGMFAGPSIGGVLAQHIGIPAMFEVTALFCFVAASLLVLAYPRRAAAAP